MERQRDSLSSQQKRAYPQSCRLAGIQREENDVVHPGLEEEISDGDIIRIVQVTYAEVSEQQISLMIPRSARMARLMQALQRCIDKELPVLSVLHMRSNMKTAVKCSRNEKSRAKIKDPTPLVLLVGSRQVVSRDGQNIRFARAIEVSATAYCPCAKCCGPTAKGTTSTGIPATKGVIAVDPQGNSVGHQSLCRWLRICSGC